MPLDEIDKKILVELQKDADRTNKEVALSVGISASAYGVRKQELKKEGYINIAATVNANAIGLDNISFVLVTLNDKSRKAAEDVVNVAKEIKNVMEVYTLLGQYDLIMKIITRNNSELLEIVESFARDTVAKTETISVARTHFERKMIEIE